MHYTLEAREDDCLQNHTVHVSIRVCRPFTKGGCAHGIRGEGELCSTYSLDKCFAACLNWWRRCISITQVHECLMQTSGIQRSSSSQQLSLDAFKDTRCDITQLRPLELVPILRQLKEDLLDFLI